MGSSKNWSWRTTLVGVLGAVAILCMQGATVLDADPLTNPNLSEILAAFSVLGLGLISRDDNVNSEDAGAHTKWSR